MAHKTIADIKAANRRYALRTNRAYWFGPDEMRFFNTEIVSAPYRGRYFITRDRMDETMPWGYSIREVTAEGRIETVSDFMKPHRSLADAIAAIPGGGRGAGRPKKKATKKKAAKKKTAKKKATKKRGCAGVCLASPKTLKIISRHKNRTLAIAAAAKKRTGVMPLVVSPAELEKLKESRPKKKAKKKTGKTRPFRLP